MYSFCPKMKTMWKVTKRPHSRKLFSILTTYFKLDRKLIRLLLTLFVTLIIISLYLFIFKISTVRSMFIELISSKEYFTGMSMKLIVVSGFFD